MKIVGVCVGKQCNDKVVRVVIKNVFIIVIFVDQLVQVLLLVIEGYIVWMYMCCNKGVNGLVVFIELNVICVIVEVKYCIQCVVIYCFLCQVFCGCCC